MVNIVRLTDNTWKQLRKIPNRIVNKLMQWINSVGDLGLEEVRKIPGYHDEPLSGQRKGQRSIRLSRSYRAIYRIDEEGNPENVIEIVLILEVSKHDY